MRASEFLTELGNAAYPITKHSAHRDVIRFQFTVATGVDYLVEIRASAYEQDYYDSMMVVFGELNDGSEWNTKATGEQGSAAIRVFSTVIECVKRALAYFESTGGYIDTIEFEAAAGEPSRVALYHRFGKSVGRFLPGWSFEEEYNDLNSVTTVVKRPARESDDD